MLSGSLIFGWLLINACAAFIKVGRLKKTPKKWKALIPAAGAGTVSAKPSPVSKLVARFEEFATVFDELEQESSEARRNISQNGFKVHSLQHTTCITSDNTTGCSKCVQDAHRVEYESQIITALEMFSDDLELIFYYFYKIYLACSEGLDSENIQEQDLCGRMLPIVKNRYQIVLHMYQRYLVYAALNSH